MENLQLAKSSTTQLFYGGIFPQFSYVAKKTFCPRFLDMEEALLYSCTSQDVLLP